MAERDEEAVPMRELEEALDDVLRGSGATLEFRDRAGRSEKLTLRFPAGGTITISANTRKAGESRRAFLAVIARCKKLGEDVAREVAERAGRT